MEGDCWGGVGSGREGVEAPSGGVGVWMWTVNERGDIDGVVVERGVVGAQVVDVVVVCDGGGDDVDDGRMVEDPVGLVAVVVIREGEAGRAPACVRGVCEGAVNRVYHLLPLV